MRYLLTSLIFYLPCPRPCPLGQAEHAPYHGYMVGDTIGDHDHALSYIMDYYPDMLPSFKVRVVIVVHFIACAAM